MLFSLDFLIAERNSGRAVFQTGRGDARIARVGREGTRGFNRAFSDIPDINRG